MPDGTVYKRKDGRYECQIIVGKTLEGKIIRKSFYGTGPRDVKQKRDEYLEKKARNEVVIKSMGFSDWALHWLKTYKEGKVRENTYLYTYKVNIEKHINPYFGNAKLCDIKQVDIQNFLNSKSNMAKSCLKRFKNILEDIFEKAIENDMCMKNPCRSLTLSSKKPETDRNVYSSSQALKVLKFAKKHEFGVYAFVMLKTGIRRGELLALTFDDIDLNQQLIIINKQLLTVNKKSYISEPKTACSNRIIPFDDELKKYLQSLKRKLKSGYIIPGNENGFLSTYAFNERFKKFMIELNQIYPEIPILTPHELRHTYGTLLREKGVDIYTIQKVLGHADIKITADVYVHNDINVLKKAMQIS